MNRPETESSSPVNQNGSFAVDRVLKSGSLRRRTRKTKSWKSIYLVMRPNRLSIYKDEKEDRLRHQIYLNELTAVAFLKDPKHKREHVFGLFSPSKNFHFEAPTQKEAEEWVQLIRKEARIEEEEEEMSLASPAARRHTPGGSAVLGQLGEHDEFLLSSSPEPISPSIPIPMPRRRKSSHMESSGLSGLSGNELASHSDFSDNEATVRLPAASFESLSASAPRAPPLSDNIGAGSYPRASPLNRSSSHQSTAAAELDPDRVIWQGWLYHLRTKGGVRQWKHLWGVLRPRNLILYKNQQEYTAQRILRLSAIVDVVDIDPMSRSKTNCLQIITEEKSYKFATHDEEALVQCVGAFKSLLAKRRELEARIAAEEQQQLAH